MPKSDKKVVDVKKQKLAEQLRQNLIRRKKAKLLMEKEKSAISAKPEDLPKDLL